MVYHHKKIFCGPKSLTVLKLLRLLSDRVLFKFLSDTVLFESSVLRFSSGSSVIDFLSRFISPLSRYAAILLLKCAPLFLLWANLLFYVIFSKKHSHSTISLRCFDKFPKKKKKKKLIAKNMRKYLHDRNAKYYIANICHQFSDL